MGQMSAESRSRIMRAVGSKDTKPEVLLRQTLFSIGVRGWRLHRGDLPGKPDLAFGRAKVAVFVDGAFWHGHPSKYRKGQSGVYWDEKIAGNVGRDRQADAALEAGGWTVLRLWDFEIMRDALAAARRVVEALASTTERSRRLTSDATSSERNTS